MPRGTGVDDERRRSRRWCGSAQGRARRRSAGARARSSRASPGRARERRRRADERARRGSRRSGCRPGSRRSRRCRRGRGRRDRSHRALEGRERAAGTGTISAASAPWRCREPPRWSCVIPARGSASRRRSAPSPRSRRIVAVSSVAVSSFAAQRRVEVRSPSTGSSAGRGGLGPAPRDADGRRGGEADERDQGGDQHDPAGAGPAGVPEEPPPMAIDLLSPCRRRGLRRRWRRCASRSIEPSAPRSPALL